jgi:hypothetical protein
MSADGENVKSSAALATSERLDWQSELDSAMSDIDSRLRHPRRRANDSAAQPTLPQLGQVDITSELLDEIAWRVSEQIRRSQVSTVVAAPGAAAARGSAENRSPWKSPPQWPDAFEPEAKSETTNAAMVIRLRWPLFRWPFRRRRRQLTSIGASLNPR